MKEKFEFGIVIRRARLGDEKGIVEMQREGLKRRNWIYTGANQTGKSKAEKIRKELKSKSPSSYSFVAIDN